MKSTHDSHTRLPEYGINQWLNIRMTKTHFFSFHIIIISKAACRLVSFSLPQPHTISGAQAAGARLVLPAVATNFISASHIISHLANK